MSIKSSSGETFIGCVVAKGERNSYDDSDFYAIVWNDDTNRFESHMYASTRFGGGDIVTIDASDELKQKYYDHLEYKYRKERVLRRWNERKAYHNMAREWNVASFMDVLRVKRAVAGTNGAFDAIDRLMCVKKFRSQFRASMATNVRNWLADANPKYSSPLSYKQLCCIL